MFRKKKIPSKPGYKLVVIKKDGIFFRDPYFLWGRVFSLSSIKNLEIFKGPTIPVINGQYDIGRKTFVEYVSEHADVAVWVLEQHLSFIAP